MNLMTQMTAAEDLEAQMSKKRTPIGKFIKSSWTNMNIRAGKYRHLQTPGKNKCYSNVYIEFTRQEYKNWCLSQKEYILKLKRPSLDRIDYNLNYCLDNIQIIELEDNIRKKRAGNKFLNGSLSNTVRGIRKVNNKWTARITIKKVEKFLGSFNTKEDAKDAFRLAYYKHYNIMPY